MGLSGSKTSQTYTPSSQATAAAGTLTSAFNAAQPRTNAIADSFAGALPGLGANLGATNAGVGAAAGYYGDVLGGKYLNGNPYLDGIASTSDAAVRDQVNSTFGAAGRTGSDAHAYALAKGIGENENSLRYGDYNAQMGRMDSAASGAGNLSAQTLASYLGLGSAAAGLPLAQAESYASGIGGLGLGGTSTTSSSMGLGSALLGLAGAGLGGWASGGFKKI